MAVDPILIYQDETIDVTQTITGNGKFVVRISPEITNTGGYNSITVTINYKEMVPDQETTSPGYRILGILESKSNGLWFPIAYQFVPFLEKISPHPRLHPHLLQ